MSASLSESGTEGPGKDNSENALDKHEGQLATLLYLGAGWGGQLDGKEATLGVISSHVHLHMLQEIHLVQLTWKWN